MANRLTYIYVLASLALVIGLGSCQSNKNAHIYDIHTSWDSVSWGGIYTGVVPARRGPGTDVQIVLNYDETFELSYRTVGDKIDSTVTRKGTFDWDDTGSMITLNVDSFPPYYWVGSNELTQLDMKGKRRTGKQADNYKLKKTVIFDWP